MRKITAGLFISLDGVVENPQDWHFPYFNDEMGAAVDATLSAADTVLFGRFIIDARSHTGRSTTCIGNPAPCVVLMNMRSVPSAAAQLAAGAR
jgi:hypothetical protein